MSAVSLFGAGFLGLLLAGYVAQKYYPAPTPRIAGIDLGTTFSAIGVYHAGTGATQIMRVDAANHTTVPSVVLFLPNGTVLVGREAVALSDHYPQSTLYDAKRFIGKRFTKSELAHEAKRYAFDVVLQANGSVVFSVPLDSSPDGRLLVTPEQVGAHIIRKLRSAAENTLKVSINRAVLSVPAEFDDTQRNATRRAANLAGIEVLRVINEPTAAALAYGLHKKSGVENVLIVDLGGGTLDVSLLSIQGGMFFTRAMAGNNHLGGQDFNLKMFNAFLKEISDEADRPLTDPEDLQTLRLAVEDAKINLTERMKTTIELKFRQEGGTKTWKRTLHREEFEHLCDTLFYHTLEPIKYALQDSEVEPGEVNEVVLVGGSTRIPRVRKMMGEYFGDDTLHGSGSYARKVNWGIDPELAVATGVAVQAGILGGAWPLQVSAIELPVRLKKIHVYHEGEFDDS